MNSEKILLAVLAGAAAGALLGVLFAPDLGWNTRKRISKATEDYSEDLEEKFNELFDTISVKFDEVKDVISGITKKSKARS